MPYTLCFINHCRRVAVKENHGRLLPETAVPSTKERAPAARSLS